MRAWTWMRERFGATNFFSDPTEMGSIEERIASLRHFENDVAERERAAAERIRRVFQATLRMYRLEEGPRVVLVQLSVLCLEVLQQILEKQGIVANLSEINKDEDEKDLLFGQLILVVAGHQNGESLQEHKSLKALKYKNNQPRTTPLNITPEYKIRNDIESLFHFIRLFSNKARHKTKYRLTLTHARIALDGFLQILEYYYCDYRDNNVPKPLVGDRPDRTMLPASPLMFVPPVFAVAVVAGVSALGVAWASGLLPGFPVILMTVFGALFILIVWLMGRLDSEYAYIGTGRWKRWRWLWVSLSAVAVLLGVTFTSLFLGFPRDETRYIALDQRVGRTLPPETIELTPYAYTDYFHQVSAGAPRPNGKEWARPDSLTSWTRWTRTGMTKTLLPNQSVIVYESKEFSGYHSPFKARFVFRGEEMKNGSLKKPQVRIVDAVAHVRRAGHSNTSSPRETAPKQSGIWTTEHNPIYQQIDFWYSETDGPANEEQVVTKNQFGEIVLNKGDQLVIVVNLESLDGEELPYKLDKATYAAILQRE